jgi:hypothetical protein
MFQIVVQSFVRGEVTVGIVLTLLLISGRSDPQTLAYSLGGIGVFLLIQGLIPLSSGRPSRSQKAVKTEPPAVQENAVKHIASDQPASSQPTDARPTTVSPCACAKQPFSRREYFARAAISSLVMIGTACLIYWFAPPIV